MGHRRYGHQAMEPARCGSGVLVWRAVLSIMWVVNRCTWLGVITLEPTLMLGVCALKRE